MMRVNIKEGLLENGRQTAISYRMMWPADIQNPAPAVVFVPGFGSSLETSDYIHHSLENVVSLGGVAIGFNYSRVAVKKNNSVDTGKLTCQNADNDLRHVLDFARDNPLVDANKLVGMGCSFGANTLFRVKDTDLAAYIAFSLVPDFVKPFQSKLNQRKRILWKMSQYILGAGTRQIVDGDVQEIHYKMLEQAEQLDLYRHVQDIDKPVTLVHGTEDILASVQDIQLLQQSMTQSPDVHVHFIDGAGHKFRDEPRKGDRHSELQQAIIVARTRFAELFQLESETITSVPSRLLPHHAFNNVPDHVTATRGYSVGRLAI